MKTENAVWTYVSINVKKVIQTFITNHLASTL